LDAKLLATADPNR
jgi:uridine kinase